jgi:hypothetical protein
LYDRILAQAGGKNGLTAFVRGILDNVGRSEPVAAAPVVAVEDRVERAELDRLKAEMGVPLQPAVQSAPDPVPVRVPLIYHHPRCTCDACRASRST